VPGIVVGLQVSATGVLLLPVGLVATILLAKFARGWPDGRGIFEGAVGYGVAKRPRGTALGGHAQVVE